MASQTQSVRPLIEQYYGLIDGGDLPKACEMFTDDAKLTFANAEPVYGPQDAQASIQYVLDFTNGVRHTLLDSWEKDEPDGNRSITWEMRIRYDLKSGTVVDNPGIAVAIANPDGKFVEQRLYGDLHNVFEG